MKRGLTPPQSRRSIARGLASTLAKAPLAPSAPHATPALHPHPHSHPPSSRPPIHSTTHPPIACCVQVELCMPCCALRCCQLRAALHCSFTLVVQRPSYGFPHRGYNHVTSFWHCSFFKWWKRLLPCLLTSELTSLVTNLVISN